MHSFFLVGERSAASRYDPIYACRLSSVHNLPRTKLNVGMSTAVLYDVLRDMGLMLRIRKMHEGKKTAIPWVCTRAHRNEDGEGKAGCQQGAAAARDQERLKRFWLDEDVELGYVLRWSEGDNACPLNVVSLMVTVSCLRSNDEHLVTGIERNSTWES